MISIQTISDFYKRLSHEVFGITELVAIDPHGKGVIATGFFDNESDFVSGCKLYNGKYNIYAGRNPRPRQFFVPFESRNRMDTTLKRRASDNDIQYVTAISLDIDPIRHKGTSSSPLQHKRAIWYALMLQKETGGYIDDSGNGAYIWIPFQTAIMLTDENRSDVKEKCRLWQAMLTKIYKPERYGLKIDGCFDLSRIKKVIGTLSVKGSIHRLSRTIKSSGKIDDRIRDAILSMPSENKKPETPASTISARFADVLKSNSAIQALWLAPDSNGDTSQHDWMLGCELVKSGITDRNELAGILMMNPFGKYRRDRRYDYIKSTVRNLLVKCIQR